MLCVGSMCTRGGIHLFTLLDWYSGSWSLLVLALLEVLIVAWLLGADRLLRLMQHSMGIRIPGPLRVYWLLTWRFISPLCIIVSADTLRTLLRSFLVRYIYNFLELRRSQISPLT